VHSSRVEFRWQSKCKIECRVLCNSLTCCKISGRKSGGLVFRANGRLHWWWLPDLWLPRFICLYNAQTSIWTWQEWMSVKWYWCATVVFLCVRFSLCLSPCVSYNVISAFDHFKLDFAKMGQKLGLEILTNVSWIVGFWFVMAFVMRSWCRADRALLAHTCAAHFCWPAQEMGFQCLCCLHAGFSGVHFYVSMRKYVESTKWIENKCHNKAWDTLCNMAFLFVMAAV